jgi:hypothetical protein
LPSNGKPKAALVLTSTTGIAGYTTADGKTPIQLVKDLVNAGNAVLLLDIFLTGSRANHELQAARVRPFRAYFDSYNLTNMQERLQDIATVITYLRGNLGCKVAVAGSGEAGLWAALAAPLADGVSADCSGLDIDSDATYVAEDTYVPCLRRAGDVKTALTLAASNPAIIGGVSEDSSVGSWIKEVYEAIGTEAPLNSDVSSLAALTGLLSRISTSTRK